MARSRCRCPIWLQARCCIAANLRCRPQFILVALLAFVIFWPQIQSIFRHASNDSSIPHMSVWRLMRAPLAALLPALIVIVPLLAYNVVRSDHRSTSAPHIR